MKILGEEKDPDADSENDDPYADEYDEENENEYEKSIYEKAMFEDLEAEAKGVNEEWNIYLLHKIL